MAEPVILGAVRTPFGKYRGAYRETRPDDLLAHALRAVVERVGIDPAMVEDVVAGAVTQVNEQGVNIARQAALIAGFPVEVPGVSLNRACGSSQQAVHFVAQGVAAGDLNYGIGAGIEHMTRVPMFSDINPEGKYKGFEMLNSTLLERYPLVPQGESAERVGERYGLTRGLVDAFAKESHRRAHEAVIAGRNTEIVPTPGVDREGNPIALTRDEGVRAAIDDARMAGLPTVFRPDGNGIVTAGNASQLSDGAGAVLVANREVAEADGFRPRARFRARVAVGSDPVLQLTGVVPATRKALERADLTLGDIHWIELNEAFATVVLGWAQELDADMDRVNPWGGAIAHGHPLGATGAGLMAKMLAGLEATGGQFGLQVLCIAHGMATATIIERMG